MLVIEGNAQLVETEEILMKLRNSQFTFQLTGSKFFGGYTEGSDLDFFTEDNVRVHIWLKDQGFTRHSTSPHGEYSDCNVAAVYGLANIHIILVLDVELKQYIQLWLFEHCNWEMMNENKTTRARLWCNAHALIFALRKTTTHDLTKTLIQSFQKDFNTLDQFCDDLLLSLKKCATPNMSHVESMFSTKTEDFIRTNKLCPSNLHNVMTMAKLAYEFVSDPVTHKFQVIKLFRDFCTERGSLDDPGLTIAKNIIQHYYDNTMTWNYFLSNNDYRKWFEHQMVHIVLKRAFRALQEKIEA